MRVLCFALSLPESRRIALLLVMTQRKRALDAEAFCKLRKRSLGLARGGRVWYREFFAINNYVGTFVI